MTEALLREWGQSEILTLTLNRPQRHNAVDPELLSELARALREDGEKASVVILRGAGEGAFSAGYDLARLTGNADDLEADRFIGEAASALRECPAPVIARIQGHCHGAGVELALSCDLRIATDDLRMSVPAVSLGVVYRFQFVARLVQICGSARASDLLLGMRQLDSDQAYRWGLVTEVVSAGEVAERVQALAEKLAATPAAAVRGTKASLRLLEARALAAEDVAAVQHLRATAAASPERQQALGRAKKRVTG